MFTKTTVATIALISAASASGFTAEQAATFGPGRALHGKKQEKTPFDAADLPRSQGLFNMFDVDMNGKIEPAEVYAMASKDMEDPEKGKAFMMEMDSNLRTYCGVPQRPVPTSVVTEARVEAEAVAEMEGLGANRRQRQNKKMKKNMKKMKNKMKKMGKSGKNKMKGMMKKAGMRAMFKKMAKMDTNGDLSVSPTEMGEMMHKGERKLCKKYKKMARKELAQSWFMAGVPADVQAEMAARKEEKKSKKGQMKKKWNNKKKNMRKKWNKAKKGRNGRKAGRKGESESEGSDSGSENESESGSGSEEQSDSDSGSM